MGSAERDVELRQGGRLHPQRLAAVGRVSRRAPVQAYDLSYSYKHNGGNVNLTGSPDYGARIVFVGRSRQRLLGQPVRAVQRQRPSTGPTYSSTGLESGRNILRGCADHTRRPVRLARHPPGRQPQLPVPPRRVQRVQHGHHQRPSEPDAVQQPDRPDAPQLADAGGRVDRPGALCRATPASVRRPARMPMRNMQLQFRFPF